jgi:hypothetical protein
MNRCDISPRFGRPLALLGIVLALAIASSPARAQPSLAPESPVTPAPGWHVSTEHYGHWVAGVDAVGFAASLSTKNPGLLIGSYLFGAPAVHLLHGNVKTAFGSFGLRAGLVLGGLLAGSMLSNCGAGDGGACRPERIVVGGLLGAGTALVTDWFLLSEKTTRVYVRPPALLRAGSLRANPDLQVSNTGSMTFGLRGSF